MNVVYLYLILCAVELLNNNTEHQNNCRKLNKLEMKLTVKPNSRLQNSCLQTSGVMSRHSDFVHLSKRSMVKNRLIAMF